MLSIGRLVQDGDLAINYRKDSACIRDLLTGLEQSLVRRGGYLVCAFHRHGRCGRDVGWQFN